MANNTPGGGQNFVQQIVASDLDSGRVSPPIVTRFPPEPNGYLHIGHAKSISLNFGLAAEFGGRCHLRFDDTNPETEDMEYVRSIEDDLRWLGFNWGDNRFFASDYFEQLYQLALRLIDDGKAYVDSLSEEEIRDYRGTVTEAGRESPFRDRSAAENRELFEQMRDGVFKDGEHVLRARIDMSSPNMLLRDPVLYRIKHARHYRRGDEFSIYPLYDFAHPLSDAIEGITHSICTLEFEVHRPLYDWLVDALYPDPRPHQYEFARLFLDYTVMSKRKLLQLVNEGHVSGWDDPRMPTIAGIRRRGITKEAVSSFCEMIGIAKADNRVDPGMLEFAIRDDLNARAPRVMCVLNPLKIVLTNIEEGTTEYLEAPFWPHDIPREGSRQIPLTREILIERDDFQEQPSRKFHRLSPGKEVRLRYGYIIRCEEVIHDAAGEISELRCTYDPATSHGTVTEKGRVKATIHWVSAEEGRRAEVRLYDRLFSVANPDDVPEDGSFIDFINPDSLRIISDAVVEPGLITASSGERFQFERQGYFFVDPIDSRDGIPVFNQIVTLKDTWAKVSGQQDNQKRSSRVSTKKTGDLQKSDKKQGESISGVSEIQSPRDPFENLSPEKLDLARGLVARFDLSGDDAALLVADPDWLAFFESVARLAQAPSAANWIIHELKPVMSQDDLVSGKVSAENLAELIGLQTDGTVSSRMAKEIFRAMRTDGGSPADIMRAKGLSQISDCATLENVIDGVIGQFPDRVDSYRNGKTGLIGFFTGQVMRATDGQANPEMVKDILGRKLENPRD